MKFLIAVVSSFLLAGVAFIVMVGPGALTGLLFAHEIPPATVRPIVESENPVATTSSPVRNEKQKFIAQASTTPKIVVPTPQLPPPAPSKAPSAVAQPAPAPSEETPEMYFQKANAQYSALVSVEVKNKNTYPPNSTSSLVAAALSIASAQQFSAVAFNILKLEEYKSFHGAYPPDFTLKISMPLVTTEYTFTRSADGKTYKLCQAGCIDSKNGFDTQGYDQLFWSIDNIQSLFDAQWLAKYKLQGRDEIIVSSLKNIRVEAELKYDANNSFAGLCASTLLNDARQAFLAPEKVICSDSSKAAAAEAYLPFKQTYFCVDTTGYNAESATSKGVGALSCR